MRPDSEVCVDIVWFSDMRVDRRKYQGCAIHSREEIVDAGHEPEEKNRVSLDIKQSGP